MPRVKLSPDERTAAFEAKVTVDQETGCWVWSGGRTGYRLRYPSFFDGTRTVRAHRWAYERWIGLVPEGLQLDHLCRRPLCVNPAHLEAVTASENKRRSPSVTGAPEWQRRKTHCPRGHAYVGANLRVTSRGHRKCRTCDRKRKEVMPEARPA